MVAPVNTEIANFAALGLDARLVHALTTLGYEEPTPIQREAIPPLLAGTEFFGGILLAIGFLTRPAALGATVVLLVTVWFHWFVQGQGYPGSEKSLLWAAMTFYFVAHGGGFLSVDRALRKEI